MRTIVLSFAVACAIASVGAAVFLLKSAGPAAAKMALAAPLTTTHDCDLSVRCVDITRPIR